MTEQRLGFVEPPAFGQQAAQSRFWNGQHVGRRARHFVEQLHIHAEVFLGVGEPAASIKHIAETIQAPANIGVVLAEPASAQFEGFSLQCFGFCVLAFLGKNARQVAVGPRSTVLSLPGSPRQIDSAERSACSASSSCPAA
jgi:hypothetical protein